MNKRDCELVNRKKETISSDKAKELIEQSIKSAKELLRKENKG